MVRSYEDRMRDKDEEDAAAKDAEIAALREALRVKDEALNRISKDVASVSQVTFGNYEQYLRAITIKLNLIMEWADAALSINPAPAPQKPEGERCGFCRQVPIDGMCCPEAESGCGECSDCDEGIFPCRKKTPASPKQEDR